MVSEPQRNLFLSYHYDLDDYSLKITSSADKAQTWFDRGGDVVLRLEPVVNCKLSIMVKPSQVGVVCLRQQQEDMIGVSAAAIARSN